MPTRRNWYLSSTILLFVWAIVANCSRKIVLILYEYIGTTGDEIRFFWRRKLTGATMLFWVNKWLAVALAVLDFVCLFQLSDTVCAASPFPLDYFLMLYRFVQTVSEVSKLRPSLG